VFRAVSLSAWASQSARKRERRPEAECGTRVPMYSLKEGFVEALVRGKKTELLSAEDYDKLRHCESLADFKAYLVILLLVQFCLTWFELLDFTGLFRTWEWIDDLWRKLSCESLYYKICKVVQAASFTRASVEHRQFEFVHFAQQASDPLMTVLQYIAHTYMIDNVILIMTGALHGRSFEVSWLMCVS